MSNILLGKVNTVLKLEVELLSKMLDEQMGEWSGYPLDCYDYYSTYGANKQLRSDKGRKKVVTFPKS